MTSERPPVRRAVLRARSYRLVEEDAPIKLNQNESPFDIPPAMKGEIFERLGRLPWNRYHQRVPEELRSALAEKLGHPAEGIIIGNGSNLLLEFVFTACVEPGSTVVIPEPSFSLFRMYAEMADARVVAVPLDEDLRYPVGEWVDAVGDSRLGILCLPNNPTGTEMDPAGVERILDGASGIVLVDEAYGEFSTEDRKPLLSRYPNLVLLRTFSKAYGAAGLRIGYLLAHPDLAREIAKVVPPFHLNLFAAVVGRVFLEHQGYFDGRVREVIAERERLRRGLGGIAGVTAYPSEANFFLVRVGGDPGSAAGGTEGPQAGDAAVAVARALARRGVLVRTLGSSSSDDAGPLSGSFRVNVGTPEENDAFLAALAEVMGGR